MRLQLSLKKRFGAGYSILASYTFSKFIDMTSDDGHGSTSSTATNPFNWFYDRGLSDNNVPHRFTTSFVWELPMFRNAAGLKRTLLGGWQLNGIVLLQSGKPFSVAAGTNRSLSGGGGDRADLIGSGAVATYGDQSRGAVHQQVFRYLALCASGARHVRDGRAEYPAGPGLRECGHVRFQVVPDHRVKVVGVALGGVQRLQPSQFRQSVGQLQQLRVWPDQQRRRPADHAGRAEIPILRRNGVGSGRRAR